MLEIFGILYLVMAIVCMLFLLDLNPYAPFKRKAKLVALSVIWPITIVIMVCGLRNFKK